MSEQNSQKHENMLSLRSKVAMLVLCPIVVIIICSVVIYFSAHGLVSEGVYDFEEKLPVFAYDINMSSSEAANLIADFSDEILSKEIKADISNSVEISDISCDGVSEPRAQMLKYISGSVAQKLASLYSEGDFTYGENTDTLKNLQLCNWLLPSQSNIPQPTVNVVRNNDQERYEFIAVYQNAAGGLCTSEDKEVKEKFLSGCAEMFDFVNPEIMLESAEARIYTDLYEGKPNTVTVSRSYIVSAQLIFKGEYAELGTQNVCFRLLATKTANLKWAGISIENNEITIHGNGYDNLSLLINIDENAAEDEYSLSFVSSDESVLTVDGNGQIEAVKESAEPVSVTAVLNYLGKTYTDSCLVYVINEVDGISVSPNSVSVTVGGKAELTAKLDPKDATIQDVIWISDNELVATVINGVVTGVGAGQTRIVAVSKDGHFVAGCTVTVTQ